MPAANRFLTLAHHPGAPLDELLLALAAQFGTVDQAGAFENLDEYSRHLFGMAELDGEAQAAYIAHELVSELGFEASGRCHPDELLFDRVLERRHGHPLVLTAVAIELARRAGVKAVACSSPPQRWFAAFGATDIVAIELGCGGGEQVPVRLRRHCSHQVAMGVLGGLRDAYVAGRHPREAGKAAALLRTFGCPR